MVCILAAALLACAPPAQTQVIEEDGFSVKGGGIQGESFFLSCPPRLVAEAGESISLSCAATGVSEEDVRYRWESVSGDDLRLLSDAAFHSPLFTAPVSETDVQYTYRVTAMSAGVYRTATVTVSVQGASGETVREPGLQEDCDPLTIPDEPGQGCAEDKGPVPFGFGFEEEEGFLFPEAPGLPDPGGGSGRQTPPRLECPVAVFLEELETGAIECHAWDVAGEEYLDYSWEPVGSTTRDYLDNPRLIPEDSPTPSVVVPEMPSYETLESFLSGDRTFRYRYRLTATSRATGLSSSSEVEVYVSSSRPGVYCPLEIIVEEGDTVTLDCEGADPLSFRMDYDEEAASVLWEWEGLWGTSLAPLDATELSSPLFTAPVGSAGKEYHYIASMTSSASGVPRTARRRVTVRVVGGGEGAQIAEDASVLTYKGSAPAITCNDSEVYEATANFTLDCSVTDEPSDATYAWTVRGSTTDTDELSSTTVLTPTFRVPNYVNGDTNYDYRVTMSASGIDDITEDVTVKVWLVRGIEGCGGGDRGRYVYEGDPDTPVPVCTEFEVHGNPDPDLTFKYTTIRDEHWEDYQEAPCIDDITLLSSTTVNVPLFAVPDVVPEKQLYCYEMRVSAPNAYDYDTSIAMVVLKKIPLTVRCQDPDDVEPGDDDIELECEVSFTKPEPELYWEEQYEYEWKAHGNTPNTDRLIAGTDGPTPTFDVPEEVDADETYEYMLTVSAADAYDDTDIVRVRVLDNKPPLALICATPPAVYEGADDFQLDCEASGAPDGSDYDYVWTGRGSTVVPGRLRNTDGPTPTFDVPEELDETTAYEYTLTVSAEGAKNEEANVTVTVKNKPPILVLCTEDIYEAYEGADDITLDCSASGGPSDSDYDYAWTGRGSTVVPGRLSSTTVRNPTFSVPDEVTTDETYEYRLTVTSDNAEDGIVDVTVRVLDKEPLDVACTTPSPVYEGASDFALDCTASGAPTGSSYTYAWTPRGGTSDTDRLSSTTVEDPIFDVPETVDTDETYEYLLTASAENAIDATAKVAVRVLKLGSITLICATPPLVYEGSEDFVLDCSISEDTGDVDYAYEWTARDETVNTDRLSAPDISSPTFYVPAELEETTTYEYLLTASAVGVRDATEEVSVTILDRGSLAVVCTDPPSVYEGSDDFDLDCSASGGAEGTVYEYVWTARGDTPDVSLLSASNIASPTFFVPDNVDADETYEYLLTISAENSDDATTEVTVTVLNKRGLALTCADPGSVYEGSDDVAFDCTVTITDIEAPGAPRDNPQFTYVWTPRGDMRDTALLSASDIASPTFSVPDNVDEDKTYEYLLTASAQNADDATAEVSVTVLNKAVLALTCADPPSVYEGSDDITFDCEASGVFAGSTYEYVWTARGDTPDTALLSAVGIASPTFYVPDEVDEDQTYEYLLTVSAQNADDATAEVAVTVLDRGPLAFESDALAGRIFVFTVGERIEDILLPQATGGFPPYTYTLAPALPEGLALSDPARTISGTPLQVSPRTEYAWQAADANAGSVSLAFFVEVVPAAVPSPPVAESLSPDPEALALSGITTSVSPLRFGVQSADTEVALDPMTDRITTHISGPYHAGRMTLSAEGEEGPLAGEEEIALSVELVSPVLLRREGDEAEPVTLALSPSWSYTESCEGISSAALGGLYTELLLSEGDCPLLLFGGELDLAGALPGRYEGVMDVILRQGETEETRTLEVDVTVVSPRRTITIGPGGVRLDASREMSAGLTEDQNLGIYPDIVFLNAEKPNEAFELSNPSVIPLEVSVTVRFGYTEAVENGDEIVVEDPADSELGDLSSVVDIHPSVLVLMPGEKGLVRYGIREEVLSSLSEKGYAAFFDIVSSPRRYADLDRMPEEVAGNRTARVTMRIPGVYVPGGGASRLQAELLSITEGITLSATFLVEALDGPFMGEVIAYDGEGRELGRREALVYTRSRVRVPLSQRPDEDAVFLRFAPRGAGRVPEPAFIRWNAPPIDIGEARDKDGATTSQQVLVRKP